MKLHTLRPAKGATKKEKRIGRGEASGKGGTSTKGNKGQQARTGYQSKLGHEGGQMPMHRRLPKRGFKSHLLKFNAEITLTTLEVLGAAEVDLLSLKQAGLVGQLAKVVKVINTGAITKAVKLNGLGATAGAKAAIEAAGGSVA